MNDNVHKTRTKAQALDHMKNKLIKSVIPDFLFFRVKSYKENSDRIINEIIKHFELKKCKLAIRSSAFSEDEIGDTHAGEFETILNVSCSNHIEIRNAISKVIISYKNKNKSNEAMDEFIVQLMLEDIIMSGVIFSRDLNTGAPYYVVNYDDISGLSNTVTSGVSEYSNRTLFIHRNSTSSLKSQRFKNLIDAVKELENLEKQNLDIEFSIDKKLNINLLQFRRMPQTKNWNISHDNLVYEALHEIKKLFIIKNKKIPGVFGKFNVLGQMPDWNPAEMIGRVPRQLALSLYQKLITNYAWIKARDEMGYFNPGYEPLIVPLFGQPYIDTRLSFNSFLPKKINNKTAEKLVNTWLINLKSSPQEHDKVEFNIAITTWSFDIDNKIEKFTNNLSKSEKSQYKQVLKDHFIQLLSDNDNSGITEQLKKIELLKIKQSNYDKNKNLNWIAIALEDCINLGTVPFAKLARHAFIAKTILLSLVDKKVFTENEVLNFQSNIRTVASELINEIRKVSESSISEKNFMIKYGHLRPGTYDILSPRYDKIKNFFSNNQFGPNQKSSSFTLSNDQISKIESLLKLNAINICNAHELLNYINRSIVSREYSKFVFTKSISDILECLADFGLKNNISRDELSHIPIDDIIANLKKHNSNISTELKEKSKLCRDYHNISSKIRLPQVISDTDSIFITPFQVNQPNFITNKLVSGEIIYMKNSDSIIHYDISRKVICIEGADPGFDWIFSRGISGLITKYGGANSHMAIRCAEFDLPAAIGCGEQRFEMILKSEMVTLDCGSGLINSYGKET